MLNVLSARMRRIYPLCILCLRVKVTKEPSLMSNHMNEINKFSKDLINGIYNALNEQLISIIIYGSYARGTQTDESDIDVAVIITGSLDGDTESRLSDAVVDLNLKYDKVFSIIDINEETFKQYQDASPFYMNVRNEGLEIWKAA